jgi:hypothetical protein
VKTTRQKQAALRIAVVTGNSMLDRLHFLARGMNLGMKRSSSGKMWRSGRRRLNGRSWLLDVDGGDLGERG